MDHRIASARPFGRALTAAVAGASLLGLGLLAAPSAQAQTAPPPAAKKPAAPAAKPGAAPPAGGLWPHTLAGDLLDAVRAAGGLVESSNSNSDEWLLQRWAAARAEGAADAASRGSSSSAAGSGGGWYRGRSRGPGYRRAEDGPDCRHAADDPAGQRILTPPCIPAIPAWCWGWLAGNGAAIEMHCNRLQLHLVEQGVGFPSESGRTQNP